jgi:hypothetical protein
MRASNNNMTDTEIKQWMKAQGQPRSKYIRKTDRPYQRGKPARLSHGANPPTLAKRAEIDLGLAVLAVLRPAGVLYSRREIGAVCGCCHQNISRIEKKALRKVREKLRRSLGLTWHEFLTIGSSI